MPRYRRLLGYLRPYAPRFAASIAATVVGSLLDGLTFALLIPFLRAIFDERALLPQFEGIKPNGTERLLEWAFGPLLAPGDQEAAFRNVVLLILAAVSVKNILIYLGRLGGEVVQERVVRDLRVALYSHLQGMRLDYFQRTRGGQLLTRMLADVEQARTLVGNQATQILQSATSALVYLAVLLSISWRLTLLALALAPLLVLTLRPLLGKLRKRSRTHLDARGELTAMMTETLHGVRLVKAYAAEEYERRRFVDAARGAERLVVKWQKLALLAHPLSETFGALITVVLLWFGAQMATGPDASLRPEAFIAFLFVALRLLAPLKALVTFPAQAQQALVAMERVFEILDIPALERMASGSAEVDRFRERIEFDHVGFSYNSGPPVLEDITFTALRGEVVAIVGPSGAGKSTLVDLIPRFYDPTSGRILLDGRDARECTLASLRRLMGIVSQETVLFNDTVKANIAYGALDRYSDPAIQAAARAANAHEFIAALPDGYDTMLGERGTRLSGGERQRIAIARALLRDPPILILDEATSALDTESERLVQEAIDRLLAGRTVFVIAHRLSTVQHATQILVLEKGRIVERGRHEELLLLGGLYKRLHDMQFREP